MDISETTTAMNYSENNVKTHCSRTVTSLNKTLKTHGIDL